MTPWYISTNERVPYNARELVVYAIYTSFDSAHGSLRIPPRRPCRIPEDQAFLRIHVGDPRLITALTRSGIEAP